MAQQPLSESTIQALIYAARAAATNAYAPYSQFPVGAAVLLPGGVIVAAGNVENVSSPLSVCAERNAVARAVSDGATEIHAVAVHAPKMAKCAPCGGCRQVLAEFHPKDRDLLVILDAPDSYEIVTLEELLPRSFHAW